MMDMNKVTESNGASSSNSEEEANVPSNGEDEANIPGHGEDEVNLTPNAEKDDKNQVPYVGMEFQSHEEAYKFYCLYAISVGFGTKVRNSHCKVRGGTKQLWYVTFTCDRAGFKEDRAFVENPRPNSRIGCKAEMRIKRKSRNDPTWVCHYVALDHNHEVLPLMSHLHRSHKTKDLLGKQKISIAHKSGTRTFKVIQMLATNDAISCGQREGRNFIDLYDRMFIVGDANAIQNYFAERHNENPSFFYQMDVSKEGRLVNVFWVDSRCRASYIYFGDSVTFDTMCITNKYNIPLSLFVGVNHHGQSVLLGCGFIANETTEAFIWLFKTWLRAMGRPPISMITDHCPAVQEAVKVVFPEVHHRLSLCHIMKKRNEQFGGMINKGDVMDAMSKCVYDTFRVEDFEREWKDMIKTYDLENNEWLQSLYEVRGRWVPVYLKNTFVAGMQTSQRSENVNHFFDGYVDSNTTLSEFLEDYDDALRDSYQKEIEADFADFHSNPILRINHCFEVQGAYFYTREIFQKFQREVLSMGNCVLTVKDVNGVITTYVVKEIITKETGFVERKEYEVTFDAWEGKVSCVCCLFEFQGILCNHALSVLYSVDITQIPSRYMLQRWRKDFKRTHALHDDHEQVQVTSAVDRSNDLWHRFIQFSDEAAVTMERYLFAVQVLTEATNKIRNMGGYSNTDMRIGTSNVLSQFSPVCTNLEQAAKRSRPKSKKHKPHSDALRSKTCSNCKKPGHTKVTCYERQVDGVDLTQLEPDNSIEGNWQLM